MPVQLGRDPEVDTEHTGGALYPIWNPLEELGDVGGMFG